MHRARPLPFDPTRLDGLSEKLIRSHWEINYGGSVRALNAVKQRLEQALADKDTPPFLYDDLKREHLMRTGSVVFHELYFANLGGSGKADSEIRRSIGAAATGYIDAFFRNIRWETVAERFADAQHPTWRSM